MPYWLLLSFQLLILIVMMRVAWRVQTDLLVPHRRVALPYPWYPLLFSGRAREGCIQRSFRKVDIPFNDELWTPVLEFDLGRHV